LKFSFIDAERAYFPIEVIAKVLLVSVSGFYAWQKRVKSKLTAQNEIEAAFKKVFLESRKTYGKKRMQAGLKRAGILLSLETIKKVMKKLQLKAKTRRKFKATTNSAHSHYVFPNLLAQHFSVPVLNHSWVSDITYVKTSKGWLYLCVVLDLNSRSIVGWSMQDRMTADLALAALQNSTQKPWLCTKDIS